MTYIKVLLESDQTLLTLSGFVFLVLLTFLRLQLPKQRLDEHLAPGFLPLAMHLGLVELSSLAQVRAQDPAGHQVTG